VEVVEHLTVGAGHAELRAAQVLTEAGREVLVLEKRAESGPKTCAGGPTRKTVLEPRAPASKTGRWLRTKRGHDRPATPSLRRPLATWLLRG
jgi:flavin-dependent dehydrogenase